MAESIQDEIRLKAEAATEVRRLLPPMEPKLQTGIREQGYRLVQPQSKDFVGVASIDGGGSSDTIEFHGRQMDACVDLSRSFISYSFTCELYTDGAGWVNVNRDHPASIRNGAGALIFDRIETSINDTSLDDEAARQGQDGGIAMSAFVRTLTRKKAGYGRGGASRAWIPANLGGGGAFQYGSFIETTNGTHLQVFSGEIGSSSSAIDEFWYLPDDRVNPLPNINIANMGENSQMPFLQSRGPGNQSLFNGRTATVAVRPSSSMWHSGTALPPGCKFDITLQRARTQRFIASQFDTAALGGRISGSRVSAVDCSLWLYVIQPSEIIRAAINNALAAEKFLVPHVAHRLYSQIVPTGTDRLNYSGLFPGQIPSRIYCGFSRALQSHRMTSSELARVSPFAMGPGAAHHTAAPGATAIARVTDGIPAIRTIRAILNGQQYPSDMFDADLSHDTLRRYNAYRNATVDPENPLLSLQAFENDFPVIVIDLNPETAAASPETLGEDIAPKQPYSANGFDLEISLTAATVESENLNLHFWCVAETPAALSFSSDGWSGGVVARRIGF